MIDILIVVLLIIFVVISYFICKQNLKPTISTVEFYPPEGLNSLDVAYIYKENIEMKDVMSLLLYLINKKYIKLQRNINGDVEVLKLKEYDGNNEYEETFFDGLFQYTYNDKTTFSELNKTFYSTVNYILGAANITNKKKFYTKESSNKSRIIIFIIIVSLFLLFIRTLNIFADYQGILLNVAFFIMLYSLFSKMRSKILKYLFLGCGIVSFTLMFLQLIDVFLKNELIFSEYILGYICIIIMMFFSNSALKKKKGIDSLYGKIIGFKRFLETTEKEKLNDLINKNPTYFYDILPYMYVLNISDKCINVFETLSIKSHICYLSDDVNLFLINKDLNNLTEEIILNEKEKNNKN